MYKELVIAMNTPDVKKVEIVDKLPSYMTTEQKRDYQITTILDVMVNVCYERNMWLDDYRKL